MKAVIKSMLVAITTGSVMLSAAWAADPVLINFDAENAPFMFGKEGKAHGVYPQIIAAAFATMKVDVKLEPKPWKRALAEIDESKGGVGGIYKNDERAKKYDFSEPILAENTAVFYNKKKPIDFKTVADLHGYTVGVIRGWSYGDDFDAARKAGKISVEENVSDAANLKKLDAGNLDAVLAIEESGKAAIAATKLGTIEQGKIYLASNKAHLAFNKSANKTDLLANFSKTIAAMKKDGSLDKIVLKELAK